MTHFREAMDPKPFICAHDLKGKEVTVQIDRVVRGEIMGEKGRKSKKPACYFKSEREKRPLYLNITNCKILASITGSDQIEDWAGTWITMFPTTTQSATGETVACIRIKNRAAKPPPERQQRGGPPQNDPPRQAPSESTQDPPPDEGRQPGDD